MTHLPINYRKELETSSIYLPVLAKSIDDLCPDHVQVSNEFHFQNETSIYFRPRPLPPILKAIVQEKMKTMLYGGIILLPISALIFDIVFFTKTDGGRNACIKY